MNVPGRNFIVNDVKEQRTDETMAAVHFIRRLDKASQTPVQDYAGKDTHGRWSQEKSSIK